MSKRRKKNYATVDDQTYTEMMADEMPEDPDEDVDDEEVEEPKKRKKWSKKKKVAVGAFAIGSAIGAAFIGGFATGRKKKKAADDCEVYNFEKTTIITDDPEIKSLCESAVAETETV